MGYSAERSQSLVTQAKPAFDPVTEGKIAEIRKQITASLESSGSIPLPLLLFSGIAGVGKTILIADLCKTTGTGFIKIPTGTLESKISDGEEIKTLEAIVDVANTSKVPVYIMLDDGEGLFDKSALQNAIVPTEKLVDIPWENDEDRINSNDVISKRKGELIQAIIDLAKNPERKISFAITTNRPDVVVDQFREMATSIEILPPGKTERIKILIQGLTRIFGAHSDTVGYFSPERLDKLGDKTEGFTGRNLIKMIEVLYSLVKANPAIDEEPILISDEHILKALKRTEPSVEALRTKKV